jgi:hypothetical protein
LKEIAGRRLVIGQAGAPPTLADVEGEAEHVESPMSESPPDI